MSVCCALHTPSTWHSQEDVYKRQMRHTACTRMAEKRMDVKVLQYIMGHAHIDVTMDVYNHVSEMSRIESEITRLENVAIS